MPIPPRTRDVRIGPPREAPYCEPPRCPRKVGCAETPTPTELPVVGDKTALKLVERCYATLESLTAATAAHLSDFPGIGRETAEKILAAVRVEPAGDEA